MPIKRSKILFFLPLPPPVTGAALRNQSLVHSKILNQTFNVKVIPFNFAGEVDDIGKFRVTKLLKLFSRTITIVKYLIHFRPDLVYFNFSLYGFALYRDFFFICIFKIFRRRLLLHLRTQGVKEQVNRSRFKKNLFFLAFNNTNIICLSNFLQQDIQDVYRGSPIIVNNGIEDVAADFAPMDRIAHEPVRIFYIGHLWRFKGIVELIQALYQLKNSGITFEAIIAGPEGDLKYAEIAVQLQELRLLNCVRIVGAKSGSEKYSLFRNSDIFVLPTHFDAFPGTVLEAMQFGLPVIGTFEGAIPEIIDNGVTGLLVKKMDVDDLASKMRILIQDPILRIQMGNQARQKFLTQYRFENFEANMRNAFLNILNQNT